MNYFIIFYMNLMFSALKAEDREVVLDKCMEPLLKLGENGFPVAIQMSGLSLEYLAKLRPQQLERLRGLIEKGYCEFIGNGYSQIIQPLVPWEVNLKNQELGMKCYEEMLGLRPKIATINEMAFSASSSRSFTTVGYSGLVMEWNNPYKAHAEWDSSMKYFPQKIDLGQGDKSDLLWGDTILTQKFQRYVHGEIELNEYMNELSQYKDQKGALCLYCSDAEVFDFRPRRYGNEVLGQGEWLRISKLLESVQKETSGLILPSNVIKNFPNGDTNPIKLESYWQPIVVKKQDKYNINRWALSGRDDFAFNTRCYSLANAFKEGEPGPDDWRNLCFLWSSDLRTHIEENRWVYAQNLLEKLELKWLKDSEDRDLNLTKLKKFSNPNKDRFIELKTPQQSLKLDLKKGLSLKEWLVNGNSILGTVPHGFFDDISLAADFYSCHSVIEPQGEHKITDLEDIDPWIDEENDEFIYVGMQLNKPDYIFKKKYSINKKTKEFHLEQAIEISHRRKSLIRSIHFTILPGLWDQGSLFYKIMLGGNKLEHFNFGNKIIDHTQNLNQLVSTRHGLGATDGEIHIGDTKNSIIFKHEPSEAALVPHLQYLPQKNGHYLLRLIYSAQELDETFKTSDKPQIIKHKLLVRADTA